MLKFHLLNIVGKGFLGFGDSHGRDHSGVKHCRGCLEDDINLCPSVDWLNFVGHSDTRKNKGLRIVRDCDGVTPVKICECAG